MATHNQDVVAEVRDPQTSRRQARSALFTGILIGIDIVGFLDETIFHQLL